MKKMYRIPLMVFSVLLSLQNFAQCSVAIVGGGCEGTKLRAVADGNTLLQLIWKIKDSVVYTSTASQDYYAKGITVAGGNGEGSGASQLNGPLGIFQDPNGNLYVVDQLNNRIQKWVPGAIEGMTVAGGNGQGSAANQLNWPKYLVVDNSGSLYISDSYNNRIQKWAPGASEGVTVAGGNGVRFGG